MWEGMQRVEYRHTTSLSTDTQRVGSSHCFCSHFCNNLSQSKSLTLPKSRIGEKFSENLEKRKEGKALRAQKKEEGQELKRKRMESAIQLMMAGATQDDVTAMQERGEFPPGMEEM